MKKTLLLGAFLLGAFFTSNAQSTSFETSEGFALGPIATQNGWTLFSATSPSANFTISNTLASVGSNSLKIASTNTASQSLLGVRSPAYNITSPIIEVSQDIRVDGIDVTNGSDVYIDVSHTVGTTHYLTSRVIFNYQGNIRIATGLNAAGTAIVYSNYGTYTANTWYNLKVRYNLAGNAILYYLNNNLIYSGVFYNGEAVNSLSFTYDDYTTGFNVDNISVGAPLSVDKNMMSKFSVYPNPTNGIVNISNDSSALNSVDVLDLNGRTVKSVKLNGETSAQVNISDLSAGVYMMNISSDQGSVTKKIVKD